MTTETIEIPIRGVCPLLMHNGALADPLDERTISLAAITGKRLKTRADHEEIARREWYGGLWLNNKLPCLPQEAIEAAFIKGAITRTKKGDAAKAGFVVNEPAMLLAAVLSRIGSLKKRIEEVAASLNKLDLW